MLDAPRACAGLQRDAPVGEQSAQQPAGRRTERFERLGLVGHDAQLDADHARVREMPGGEQRELVQRQRPGVLGRLREREPLLLAAIQAVDELAQRGHVGGASEVQRTRQPGSPSRAHRHDEHVVLEPLAALEDGVPAHRIDCYERVAVQPCVGLARKLGELEQPRLGQVERRGHRERLVDVARVGRDQMQPGRRARERAEREHRLDRAYPAPADDHARHGGQPLALAAVRCG